MKWEKGEKRKSPSLIYRLFAFWAIRWWNFQCLFVFCLVLFWCIFGDAHYCVRLSLPLRLIVGGMKYEHACALVVTTFLTFIHSLIHDIYMVTASIVQRRRFKFMNCDDTLDVPNRTQFVLNSPDGNIYLNVATHKLRHAFRTMCDALTHLWVYLVILNIIFSSSYRSWFGRTKLSSITMAQFLVSFRDKRKVIVRVHLPKFRRTKTLFVNLSVCVGDHLSIKLARWSYLRTNKIN